MIISSSSGMQDLLIQQATNAKSNQMSLTFGVAVLKQTIDQQKEAGEAIVRMIQNSSVSQGVGVNVDISA